MKYLESTAEEPLVIVQVGADGAQAYTCRVDELFGDVFDREDRDMLAWFKWSLPALLEGGSVTATGEAEDENGEPFQQVMSYSTSEPRALQSQWTALLAELGIREEDLPEVEDSAELLESGQQGG